MFLQLIDKPEESDGFINNFLTRVSKLKVQKSITMCDSDLISALILYGVKANEYYAQK